MSDWLESLIKETLDILGGSNVYISERWKLAKGYIGTKTLTEHITFPLASAIRAEMAKRLTQWGRTTMEGHFSEEYIKGYEKCKEDDRYCLGMED